MKISHESEKLVEIQYAQAAQEISSKYHREVQRLERSMPRGGGMKGAIDEEYIQMAKELVQALLNAYLEAFPSVPISLGTLSSNSLMSRAKEIFNVSRLVIIVEAWESITQQD